MSCYCVLQTAGTEVVKLLQNDRQRVVGGGWVTAGTDIFEPQSVFRFDCARTVHLSSATFHEFHSVVGTAILPQSG
jgi:hypothetical protein